MTPDELAREIRNIEGTPAPLTPASVIHRIRQHPKFEAARLACDEQGISLLHLIGDALQ